MFLPHTNHPHSSSTMAGKMTTYHIAAQVDVVLSLLSTSDTAAWFETNIPSFGELKSINYYMPRYWAPVFEAASHAQYGDGIELSYNDLFCNTCETFVSKVLDFEHWDDLCGNCYTHSDECSCCEKCGNQGRYCDCCMNCGESKSWCECCSYCEMAECECAECRDCGEKTWGCTCGGGGSSYQFGKTKQVPWEDRADAPMAYALPTIKDCENEEIDPIQAAANFYLLDAIKGSVRFADVTGASDGLRMNQNNLVRDDSMLNALRIAGEREYNRLVERLAPSFLAYAISAVGGELRYHKAVNLASSRDKAWDKFVKLVQVKGPETLFEADILFREFGSSSYGGVKWGQAAKVVGMYLNESMPAWLFVDRVFTLQHNGGCFLNKVNWARKNKARWGLSHMQVVLNAHAGKDAEGDEAETDWDLLCMMASPEIAQMFRMTDRAVDRIAHRFGGYLVRPNKSKMARRIREGY